MRLWSDDFTEKGPIPSFFTCDGKDLNPRLEWEDVPAGTRSFALICDDPDAPRGTWVHWLLCDIPADCRKIPRGRVPGGARQLKNDFGKLDYGGPCPPSGTHRYFFKLYALNVPKLDAKGKDLYQLVEKHKLAGSVYMGVYSRR